MNVLNYSLTPLADQALSRPLTVIRAGRGYGKTLLCRDIMKRAQQQGHPAWFLTMTRTIEVSARGAAEYIMQALDFTGPRHHLPQVQRRPDASPLALGHALADDLRDLPEGSVVIFDATEILATTCQSLFNAAFTDLPEHVHVVFAGRAELLSMRQLNAVEIGASDLRIPPQHAYELGLDDATYQRLQGWPVLIRERLLPHGDEQQYITEVLDQSTPSDLYEVLLRASALDVWTKDDALHTAIGLPAGWLTDIQAAGVPVNVQPDGSMGPPPILRDLLRQRLANRPALHHEVLARLGEATRKDAPLRAARYFAQAGDTQSVLEIADRAVRDWQARREHGALVEVLRPLQDELRGDVQLALAEAMFMTGEAGKALALLDKANRYAAPQPQGFMLAADLRMRLGQPQLAYALGKRAMETLQQADVPDRIRLLTSLSLVCSQLARNGIGRHAFEARELAEKARQLVEQMHEDDRIVDTITAMALSHSVLGQMDDAERSALAAVNTQQRAVAPEMGAAASLLLADLLADHGKAEAASDILRYARNAVGLSELAQTTLDLGRARLALRMGKLNVAAQHGLRALDRPLAEWSVLGVQARLLLVWPLAQLDSNSAVLRSVLEDLQDAAVQQPQLARTVEALQMLVDVEQERARGALSRTMRERLDASLTVLPPHDEVLALVVLVHARERGWTAVHERLLNSVRARLGQGVVAGYALLFRMPQVEAMLARPQPTMTLQLLGDFDLRVNRKRVHLPARAQLLLASLVLEPTAAALTSDGSDRQRRAPDVFGGDRDRAVKTFDQARRELEARLQEASGLVEPLGLEKVLHLGAFVVSEDVGALELLSVEQLVGMYGGTFMAGVEGGESPFVDRRRSSIRALLERRLRGVSEVAERERLAALLRQVDASS